MKSFILSFMLAVPAMGSVFNHMDRVVFFGDSNTYNWGYVELIKTLHENYYPEASVQFINSGFSGDTAVNSLVRLQQDVYIHRPHTVFVMFGINDIAWGKSMTPHTKQTYVNAIASLVNYLKAEMPFTRVIVASYPTIQHNPNNKINRFLIEIGDEALEQARKQGAETIDLARMTQDIHKQLVDYNQRTGKNFRLHYDDGVHFAELGHLAVAYSVLAGLQAHPTLLKQLQKHFPNGEEVLTVKKEYKNNSIPHKEQGFTRAPSCRYSFGWRA